MRNLKYQLRWLWLRLSSETMIRIVLSELKASPEPVTRNELCRRTSYHNDKVSRLLRTLHRKGLVRRDEAGYYRLEDAGRRFIERLAS